MNYPGIINYLFLFIFIYDLWSKFLYLVSLFWIITITKNCNYNFSKERFPVIIFLLAALTKYNLIKVFNCSYFINILMSKYIDEKMILSISDTESTSIVGYKGLNKSAMMKFNCTLNTWWCQVKKKPQLQIYCNKNYLVMIKIKHKQCVHNWTDV